MSDVCTAHASGLHRYDIDILDSRGMLLSNDLIVQVNVLPPKKCACGKLAPRDFP